MIHKYHHKKNKALARGNRLPTLKKGVIVSDPCQTFQATSNNFTKQEKPTLRKIIFKNKMVKFSKEGL
jgi:hypothetical protein